MRKLILAAGLLGPLFTPLVAEACTATGYVITVIVPGNFPASAAAVYVRHPTSTGSVTSALTTNSAIVAAASAAVTGTQRVLLNASGGGAGVCPAAAVGIVNSLALRP